MRAGKMRHKVRIEQRTNTVDDGGGNAVVWSVLDVLQAEIKPAESGNETVAASGQKPRVRQLVSTRWRTGVTTDMRAVINGRVFDIESAVNVEEKNEELLLTCLEHVGEDPY